MAAPIHEEDDREAEDEVLAAAAVAAAACREEWTRRAWAMAMVDKGVVLECAAKLIWLSESAIASEVDTELRRPLEEQVLV